jgi:hypothetical protein
VVREPEEKVDTLLREVDGWKKMRVRSVAWANMPERMKPLSEEGEKVVLDQLREELRQNFGVRVSGSLDHSRVGDVVKPVYKYAVLGGSNADRLGDAMIAMGKDVGDEVRMEAVQEGSGGDAADAGGEGPGGQDCHPVWDGQWSVLQGR